MSIEFLKIKRRNNKVRKNGTKIKSMLWMKKSSKYGKVLREKTISVKTSILVTGGHNSGKSRWLDKIYKEYNDIYMKYPDTPVYLDGLTPISQWYDGLHFENWYNEIGLEKWGKKYNALNGIIWKKLKAWQRQIVLVMYIKETKSLLFIDNLNKLSGSKLRIAKDCLNACNQFVVSTNSIQRVRPSIRNIIIYKKPQEFHLKTKVAYDQTHYLLGILAILFLLAGSIEGFLAFSTLTAMMMKFNPAKQK